MRLIGYVSDERHRAINDVAVELERDQQATVVRSSPTGAIRADVRNGRYRITLSRDGYGPKTVEATIGSKELLRFRLLSDRLLGYAWPKWVRSGEASEFRVHSPEPYALSLWRYGREPELVRGIGIFDEHGPQATMQVLPDGDFTQTGVQWNRRGYTNPDHTQRVVGPERSGLYYFHAEGQVSGRFFSFPWVVAPREPCASIAVIASTNTWNAYNNFGGRSNYVNAIELPMRPVVNARLDMQRYSDAGFSEWDAPDDAYAPLSFERPEPNNQVRRDERPTDPIVGRQECGLAPAEWRLLSWLERENFPYDLYAEAQIDSGVLDVDRYRVVILSTHPEYVTRTLYETLRDWVEQRGGHLMYLGGNGLDCEVAYDDPAAPTRLQVFTQIAGGPGGGWGGGVDPADPGHWLETRFHRRHESATRLLGVVCTPPGIMTGAPYRVIAPDHWVFEGTALKAGDLFGVNSLHERCPGGASGHETDKMSGETPDGTRLLAKGLNPDEGGAELVHRELAGGGEVFSVGSIIWPASILVDEGVSAVTRNVLRRFLQSPSSPTGSVSAAPAGSRT